MDNINQGIIQVAKPQKPRNLPIPRQANHFILENFGESYYQAKNHTEKLVILKNISNSISNFGYYFNEAEIERRLKNMRTHYRRKKEDLERGNKSKTEWEYYPILDKIMNKINGFEMPQQGPSCSTFSGEAPQSVKVEPNVAQKRPRNVQFKLENQSSDVEVEDDDNAMPIDMSMKKPKVIEFNNNINDVSEIITKATDEIQQNISNLVVDFDSQSITKLDSIRKISDKLKVIDQLRVSIDEKRLQLEVRRNELDRIGYELTDYLIRTLNA